MEFTVLSFVKTFEKVIYFLCGNRCSRVIYTECITLVVRINTLS